MKQVMKRAWEIAKEGAKKFGGKAIEYIGVALKLAWREVKKAVNDLPELKGSEKQIKWANQIREHVIKGIKDIFAIYREEKEITEKFEARIQITNKKIDEVVKNDSAAFWIDNFKDRKQAFEIADQILYILLSNGIDDMHERVSVKKVLKAVSQTAFQLYIKESVESAKN